MAEVEDVQVAYEELLEFLYLCPYALVQMDAGGAIQLMNPLGAQIFMRLAQRPVLENLFELLDPVAPELRRLVEAFPHERGPICDGVRVEAAPAGGNEPIPVILQVSLLKLGPGRFMAVVAEISRLDAEKREGEAALARSFAELAAASDEKSLLLRCISDGLVTLDAEGRPWGDLSAALRGWFGEPQPGQTFAAYVAAADPQASVYFSLGWQSLVDDFLPMELTLEQMPRRIRAGERTLRIDYRPVLGAAASPSGGDPGPLRKMLLILSDITSEVERERLEAEQRELLTAIDKLLRNRSAFRAFLRDAAELVAQIATPGRLAGVELLRALHTLKGNCGVFGLSHLATLCHALEDLLVDSGELGEADRAALRQRFQSIEGRFARMLGDAPARIEISATEHELLLQALRGGAPAALLEALVDSWRLPSARSRLEHLADQAQELAGRLGKGPLRVEIEHGDLRLDERWDPLFAALVHAVRNAVDHGLEPAAERVAAGKGAEGRLALRATRGPEGLQLELEDDGRGIDWERLAARAREQGLPAEGRAELVAALFADGVSTREAVSEVSGRGVGMGAIRAACLALGGTLDVGSAPGQGTTLRLRFPDAAPPPLL